MELASKFNIKGLSMIHYFLRLEVWQRLNDIFLKRNEYTVEILRNLGWWTAVPWLSLWWQSEEAKWFCFSFGFDGSHYDENMKK